MRRAQRCISAIRVEVSMAGAIEYRRAFFVGVTAAVLTLSLPVDAQVPAAAAGGEARRAPST